jgi:hypothetical protein
MNKTVSSRIDNFDFLRGAFILLALLQHFSYYTNVWFSDYFLEMDYVENYFAPYFSNGENSLPVDDALYYTLRWGTHWISQIYLMMAAFNIPNKGPEEFKKTYKQKLKIYGTLFIFFICENFLIAENIGDALSFYPLLAWMLILTLITIIYRFFNIKGLIAVFLLVNIKWLFPMENWNDLFVQWMEIKFHPAFDYDARIDHFITSGLLGAIYGHIHHQLKWSVLKKFTIPFITGFFVFLAWYFLGPNFEIVRDQILQTEHDVSKYFFGMAALWGIQIFIVSGFLYLDEIKKIKIKVPVVNWVGQYSLAVFGVHRVFFIKILMPLIIYFSAYFGFAITNSIWHIMFSIIITVAFSYWIKRSNVLKILFK